jgi:hypothetical protein
VEEGGGTHKPALAEAGTPEVRMRPEDSEKKIQKSKQYELGKGRR